jgi:hypothetical protein
VCHSSIFYGLVENKKKMNERHVTTISNTAENKGGNNQDCVNDDVFIFDFTYNHSLKSMAVVFFLEWILEHCGFVIVFIDECG